MHFALSLVRMAAEQGVLHARDAQGAQVAQVAAGEDARDARDVRDALHARRAAAVLTRKAGERCATPSAVRATTMPLAAYARPTARVE